MRLKNLQSWKDTVIDLKEDGLTIIEARSETGKSVFISAIRLGLNYDKYTNDIRRNIVRKWWDYSGPEDNGSLSIITDDGTAVIFTFGLNNVKTNIIYTDKTVRTIYGPADEEVLEILSLVKCGDSSRILNIIDNEDRMLWVDTSFEDNDAMLKLYLYDKDLEERQEVAVEKTVELKEAIKVSGYRQEELSNTLTKLTYVPGIDIYERIFQEVREVAELAKCLEKSLPLVKTLKDCELKKTLEEEEFVMGSDLENIKNFNTVMLSLKTINSLDFRECVSQECLDNWTSDLIHLGNLNRAVIEINTGFKNYFVEDAELKTLKDSLENIKNSAILNLSLYQINNLEKKKKEVSDFRCVEKSLETVDVLLKLRDCLKGINSVSIISILEEETLPDVSDIKAKKLLLELINSNVNIFTELEEIKSEKKILDGEYTEFVTEHNTCPVCSSILEDTL